MHTNDVPDIFSSHWIYKLEFCVQKTYQKFLISNLELLCYNPSWWSNNIYKAFQNKLKRLEEAFTFS